MVYIRGEKHLNKHTVAILTDTRYSWHDISSILKAKLL